MPNNLKQATKKSLNEANVAKLDNLGADIGEFIQEKGLTVIENVIGDFIERVHKNINETKGMVTTGKINDITMAAENGSVNVYAHKWLIYQDRGVNGSKNPQYNTPHKYTNKMPPVAVFKQWIKDKNIRLVNNHKYKGDDSPFKELTEEQQINNAAWGMATKVFREGFKPRNVYSKEIPKLIEDLSNEVGNFCVQAIVQYIDVKPDAQRVILPKG
jgi:hypothetical protein